MLSYHNSPNPQFELAYSALQILTPLTNQIRELCERSGIDTSLSESIYLASTTSGTAVRIPAPWQYNLEEDLSRAIDFKNVILNLGSYRQYFDNLQEPLIIIGSSPGETGIVPTIFYATDNQLSPRVKEYLIAQQLNRTTSIFAKNPLQNDLESFRALQSLAMCEMANEAISLTLLQKLPLPEDLNLLFEHRLAYMIACFSNQFRRAMDLTFKRDELPASQFERIFYEMASRSPELGQQLPLMLKALDAAHKQRSTELQDLSEAVQKVCNTEQINFSEEYIASDGREFSPSLISNNLAAVSKLSALTLQPEWSDGIGVLRNQIEKHLVFLFFDRTRDQVFNDSQLLDIFAELFTPMTQKPEIIMTSSYLDLVSPEGQDLYDILSSLKQTVQTGIVHFAQSATAVHLHERLERITNWLFQMKDLLDSTRIHFVADVDLDRYINDNELTQGVVFQFSRARIHDTSSKRAFFYFQEPQTEEMAVAKALDSLGDENVQDNLKHRSFLTFLEEYATVNLVRQFGGSDKFGLVGFNPLVALKLAFKEGILPAAQESSFATIIYENLLMLRHIPNDGDNSVNVPTGDFVLSL